MRLLFFTTGLLCVSCTPNTPQCQEGYLLEEGQCAPVNRLAEARDIVQLAPVCELGEPGALEIASACYDGGCVGDTLSTWTTNAGPPLDCAHPSWSNEILLCDYEGFDINFDDLDSNGVADDQASPTRIHLTTAQARDQQGVGLSSSLRCWTDRFGEVVEAEMSTSGSTLQLTHVRLSSGASLYLSTDLFVTDAYLYGP